MKKNARLIFIIFTVLLVLAASSVQAATADTQNQAVSLGFGNSVETVLLDIWNGKSLQGRAVNGSTGWAWDLTPSAKAKGEKNKDDNVGGVSKNNIQISYGGFIYVINLDENGNINNDKFNHAIPIAIGVESSTEVANKYNELLEIGYAPILLTPSPLFRLGLNPYLAVYYQFGQKWISDNDNTTLSRAHVTLKYLLNGNDLSDSGSILSFAKLKLNYDAWYDFNVEKDYYDVDVSLQARLSDKLVYDIVKYSHGNGAPSFTQGTQWTTGLTITY